MARNARKMSLGAETRALWRALLERGEEAHDARLHALAWPCALAAVYLWSGGRRPDESLARTLLPHGSPCLDALCVAWRTPVLAVHLGQVASAIVAQGEDRSLHGLFEGLVRELEPEGRRARGQWFTPAPLARYMIDALDALLRDVFRLPEGFADESIWSAVCERLGCALPEGVSGDARFVRVLDPSMGTGVFLEALLERAQPVFTGWEIDPAAHVVAQLTLAGALRRRGHPVKDVAEVGVECRDALTSPRAAARPLSRRGEGAPHTDTSRTTCWRGTSPSPCRERGGAAARGEVTTVVLGNPPYSYRTGNPSPEAVSLVEPFRAVDGEPVRERGALSLERSLQDDFVKFFGVCVKLGERAGGLFALSLVTSNTYLASPMLRGLRAELARSFPYARVVDLHGDSLRDRDANVFGISRGVAIFTGGRAGPRTLASHALADARGTVAEKLEALQQPVWKTFVPARPMYRFAPSEIDAAYAEGWPIDRIFRVGSTCIKTLRDPLATADTPEVALEQVAWFRDPRTSREAIEARFGVRDVVQWSIDEARARLQGVDLSAHLRQYTSRPFETRWMVYHPAVVGSPRPSVMRPLDTASGNVAMITNRRIRTRPWAHLWCAKGLCVSEILSGADNAYCFPLYLAEGVHNLGGDFIEAIERAAGLRFTNECAPDDHVCPRCVFGYVYAVGHAPRYRERYGELLAEDFPRVPLPRDGRVFRACARIGNELVALHTETVARPASHTAYDEEASRVGTWQPARRYVEARRHRPWTDAERQRYAVIVGALGETARLAREVDAVLESASP